MNDSHVDQYAAQRSEELEAEIARLREALERVAQSKIRVTIKSGDYIQYCGPCEDKVEIARAALAGEAQPRTCSTCRWWSQGWGSERERPGYRTCVLTYTNQDMADERIDRPETLAYTIQWNRWAILVAAPEFGCAQWAPKFAGVEIQVECQYGTIPATQNHVSWIEPPEGER